MRPWEHLKARGPCVAAALAMPGEGKTSILIEAMLSGAWPHVACVDPEFELHLPGRNIQYLKPDRDDWRKIPQGSLVVLDELDGICKDVQGGYEWCLHIFRACRPWGITVLWSAQTPYEVPRGATRRCRLLFLGQILEERDLEYLRTYYPKAPETLPNLAPHRFLVIRR